MIEQNTDEWRRLRSGKITASNFKRVMVAKTDRALRTLAREIAEEAVRIAAGDFSNSLDNVPAIRWGKECEPEARACYVLETGNDVAPGGFHVWRGHPLIAASPDGLIGDDGLVEFKCPFGREQHHTYGNGPGSAIWQVQGQMLCTGRKWADFVSFDPRERPELRLYVTRVERDGLMQRAMGEKLIRFADTLLRPMLEFVGLDLGQLPTATTRPCLLADDGKTPNLF